MTRFGFTVLWSIIGAVTYGFSGFLVAGALAYTFHHKIFEG